MYFNYPLMPYGENIRLFFLASLGFHIMNTYEQLTAPVKRSDYYEMTLHHCLTMVLIVGSYLINLVEIGVLVIYIHDFTDIFSNYGKCFADSHFEYIQYFNAVAMWFGWILTRLVAFPLVAYTSITLPYSKPFASVYIGAQDHYLN